MVVTFDVVLHGGRVFTGDATQAQALAVRAGRIVAVGDDESILALAGDGTRRIDLRGHRVVPGINDAHEHLGWQPAPGYLADLAVLSQDIFDETTVPTQQLPPTRSLLTMIDGDIVWQDPEF